MVMHARKLPRLNDGYFERNQTHPYQNTGKYSGKSNYNERYNDKVRDSPSNGSSYRSESPDAQHSPRDRSYHNKSSYSQRVKERERERHERDNSRSPKDKASKSVTRDHQSSCHRNSESVEHRSNHDRNNIEDKEKDKRIQVGDWSEHISSSGKKYYYNCKTEISQWEKPKEWIEWERQQGKSNNEVNKVKERNYEKSSTSSSTRSSEKHSTERNSRSSSSHHHHHSRSHDDRHHFKPSSSTSSVTSSRNYIANEQSHRNNQPQHKPENHVRGTERGEQKEASDDPLHRDGERRTDIRKSSEDSQMQDMDISPDSTPTGGSQPNSQPQSRTQTPVSSQASQHLPVQTPVSTASLPKLLSQLTGNKGLTNLEKTEISAQEALQTLLLLTRQVSLAQTNLTNQSPHTSITNSETSPFLSQKSPLPLPMPSHSSVPVMVTNTPSQNEGKVRADEADRGGRTSPGGSEYSHRSSRRGSPTSSISSLHSITPTGTTSLASAALRPAAPLLTPSLANYFREDLISHVTGWQADHAERQANRYSEDAHSVGSLSSTKVSADLKMARSLVRVAEIQSTLQEQRILFLRQQIKELEEWKSRNSFMSDS